LVLPRTGPLDAQASGLAGGVHEALAAALGALAMTGVRCDVGEQAGIHKTLPMAGGINTAIAVEVGASEIHPHRWGHLFQGV